MSDDIVTRLRDSDGQGCICEAYSYYECGCIEAVWAEMFIEEAADEIERLRTELGKWATKPPNTMVCLKHGEEYMCWDDYMGGVFWCEGCRHD